MDYFYRMINTSELRIGNLFQDTKGNIQVAYTIHETVVNESWTGPFPGGDYKLNPGYGEDDMEPIPLSAEWLVRMGFENGEIKYSHKLHMTIRPYQTATQGIFPGEWEITLLGAIPHALGRTIRYVHQLQNLYFDLTGEEVTIKTPISAL